MFTSVFFKRGVRKVLPGKIPENPGKKIEFPGKTGIVASRRMKLYLDKDVRLHHMVVLLQEVFCKRHRKRLDAGHLKSAWNAIHLDHFYHVQSHPS